MEMRRGRRLGNQCKACGKKVQKEHRQRFRGRSEEELLAATPKEKDCSGCFWRLPSSRFFRDRSSASALVSSCKACMSALRRGHPLPRNGPNRPKGVSALEYFEMSVEHRWWVRAVTSARARAKRSGIFFDLDPRRPVDLPVRDPVFKNVLPYEDVSQAGVGYSKPRLDAPSINRLINGGVGYTDSNVEVISWIANHFYNSMTTKELVTLAEHKLRQKHEQQKGEAE